MLDDTTRDRLAAMLRDGATNRTAARTLGIDKATAARYRTALGLPPATPPPPRNRSDLTVEEKFATYLRPVEDGHAEWTGRRAKSNGTPTFSHHSQTYTARSIGFRIRTGRDPVGYVTTECDRKNCVAPDHLADEPGRIERRAQLAEESGRPTQIVECGRGHDVATHRRYTPGGNAYCGTCHTITKQARKQGKAVSRPPATKSAEEAFRLRTQPVDGGHVLWTGTTSHGTPALTWRGKSAGPYRLAFRLHYGREPEGYVTAACDVPLCVAGPCMQDQPMRKADRLFEQIFGTAA
ncbi:hypothetical protein [Streptomyces sp. NPDC058254]|uniref:hypothetical protein n=1 Tax=Streptomyces sp. NPDC058254 TaxID=3346406 RepID=UPI0036E1C8B6